MIFQRISVRVGKGARVPVDNEGQCGLQYRYERGA